MNRSTWPESSGELRVLKEIRKRKRGRQWESLDDAFPRRKLFRSFPIRRIEKVPSLDRNCMLVCPGRQKAVFGPATTPFRCPPRFDENLIPSPPKSDLKMQPFLSPNSIHKSLNHLALQADNNTKANNLDAKKVGSPKGGFIFAGEKAAMVHSGVKRYNSPTSNDVSLSVKRTRCHRQRNSDGCTGFGDSRPCSSEGSHWVWSDEKPKMRQKGVNNRVYNKDRRFIGMRSFKSCGENTFSDVGIKSFSKSFPSNGISFSTNGISFLRPHEHRARVNPYTCSSPYAFGGQQNDIGRRTHRFGKSEAVSSIPALLSNNRNRSVGSSSNSTGHRASSSRADLNAYLRKEILGMTSGDERHVDSGPRRLSFGYRR